jgi:iron complex transport system ATP-binding protein
MDIDIIKLLNLEFRYRVKSVLKNINLNFKDGDFVGIVGPNGCGKSTLLKNISGFLKPFTGKIIVDEKELLSYSHKELSQRISVVPQETRVDFDFSVEEIVLMGRNPHISRFRNETPKDKDKVFKAMELTGITSIRNKPITAISGGERQRVIIARAIAQDTGIILLDEPTSHQDIKHQVEIMELLTLLNIREEITILSVFHDLNLAAQFCNRLIVMKDGQIFTEGRPEGVITEGVISDVYEREVMVGRHPLLGCPHVYLTPPKRKKEQSRDAIILVSGGGIGSPLILAIIRMGFPLVLGGLNIGDSDWQLGHRFGLPMVEIPPFSPMTDIHGSLMEERLKEVKHIVISSIPFGKGNVKNLEAIYKMGKGKNIVIIEETSITKRDYTDGVARDLYNLIKENLDAIVVNDNEEALTLLANLYQGSE